MEARNVLLIEDEPVDAARVRRSLQGQAGGELGLEHVTTLRAGFERVARGDVDAVLLDLNLPDSQGIDTVVRLREPDPALPIVVLTATSDEETAFAALAAGAQDYLVKDELESALLQRTIRYAIERSRIAQDQALLERRLHQVEKVESLGALCAGMGFGFNTLIGTIFDHCDDALVSLEMPAREPRVRRDLFEIHRAAFRAAEMVQRLRDYGAIERSADGKVDLARFALEASDLLAAIVSQEIDVVCEVGGEPIVVDITRPELHRLLMSLVVNAGEAIGASEGSISISVGVREAHDALLAESAGWPHPKAGSHAFLRVADTGPGLGAAERARIFDPFYTTRFAGRGLGLASVAGILQRRRAVVLVEANRPTGTVFTILFPRAR
jgi:signal transduction histidine kinase